MANLPEYSSGVMADSFQVRPVTQSNEPELLFEGARTAANVAQAAGGQYVQEMVKRSEAAGHQAVIYEQQPDGTQRLRPIEDLQAIDFGAGNQAYNAALLQQYSGELTSQAREAYGGFQTRYANSPDQFRTAAQAYNTEVLNRLPRNVRGAVAMQLNTMSSQFAGGIAERRQRIAQEQQFQTSVRTTTDLASDIDSRSLTNPNDPQIPVLRQQLEQQLGSMRLLHGDRVNDVTVRDNLRTIDLTVEGNRVTWEASQIYNRAGGGAAGRVAAQRYLDTIRRPQAIDQPGQPGGTPARLPWTTAERDQIVARANAWIGDQENRRNLARSEQDRATAEATLQAQIQAQLRLQNVNPENTAERTRVVEEVMGQFRNRLPTQALQDQLRASLTAPISTEQWRRQSERDRAEDNIHLLRAMDENRAADAAGRPRPYPLSAVMQDFQPHQWAAATATIIEQQNTAATASALYIRQVAQVQDRMARPNDTTPAEGPAVEAVLARQGRNAQGNPGPIDWTNAAQRETGLAIARGTRYIPQAVQQGIASGTAQNASMAAAEHADVLFAGLTSDQRTRVAMEGLLGTSLQTLQANRAVLATINSTRNGNTYAGGTYDRRAAEGQWQAEQSRRDSARRMTDQQFQGEATRIFGPDPEAAIRALSQTATGMRQPGSMGPNARAAFGTFGQAGLAFGQAIGFGSVDAQIDTGLPGGNPYWADIPYVGRIDNLNYGYSLLGGTASLPLVANDAWGYGQVFREGVRNALALGTNTAEQAGNEAYRYARQQGWGPSFFASGRTDAAVMVQNGPEETWRQLNLEPVQGVSQIVGGLIGIHNAFEANRPHSSPFRTPGNWLQMLQTKEVFLQVQQGQDGRPVYIVMAEGPPEAGGFRRGPQPIQWVPGMERHGLAMGPDDSVVIQFQSNPDDPASAARRQELRTNATGFVTRTYPALSGAGRQMMIMQTEIAMQWGFHQEIAPQPVDMAAPGVTRYGTPPPLADRAAAPAPPAPAPPAQPAPPAAAQQPPPADYEPLPASATPEQRRERRRQQELRRNSGRE